MTRSKIYLVETGDGFRGPTFGFLSNFARTPLIHDGLHYPTAEHLFQALKTHNPLERERIAKLPTPGQAKKAGRQLALRSDWPDVYDQVMAEVIELKFPPGTEAARRLVGTDPTRLVEVNWWHDNLWGDCRCARWENCATPGRNLLGRALEARREVLRREMQPRQNGNQGRKVYVPNSNVILVCPKCEAAPVVYNGNYFCDDRDVRCDWGLAHPAVTERDRAVCDILNLDYS